MKRFFALLILILLAHQGFTNHLKGGVIQYSYIGPGTAANTSRYEVTIKQYLDCGSNALQRDANVFLGVFDGATNQLLNNRSITIPRSGSDELDKTDYSPCISRPPPPVCYIIDIYTTNIDLPDNAAGYTLTVQRCCRIKDIKNVGGTSNDIGVSYTTKIPGIIDGVNYSHNSSPVFAQKDTAVVCYNAPFTFDFGATDADGDQLTYEFCDGLIGGSNTVAGSIPNPPSNPPYGAVPYAISDFSGSSPMGAKVTIDSKTGVISGIAPSEIGDYIVSVCVNEYRNGVHIGSTKKEIHITVADCSISAASLKPIYITCNGTTMSFQNESTNSNITSYLWDFGVPSLTSDTSSGATPTYDYLLSGKDSGTYTVKLVVATSSGCMDSTTTLVKIYPGFNPAFNIKGTCYLNNYQFLDATVTKYGTVNSWKWDFGDNTASADTARSKDSVWKYPAATNAQVRLIVTNSKGCIDTITKPLTILDKPLLNLPFRDTLICSIDTLALKADVNSGSVLWTPANGPNKTRIMNASTATPLVFPKDTTKYYISVNDNGCANTDSVNVNVLQFISVQAGVDTGICKTDTIRLRPLSDALSYQWIASTGETVQQIKSPLVQPLSNTQYLVIANLGKCQAKDSVFVKVAPYPVATAGADATICYGNRVQITGTVTGTAFSWRPIKTLINENTLTPVAGPTSTTNYILTATDTVGCPKAASDTIIVTVIPPIYANAGADTFAVPEEPVQLNATGGSSYLWTPATGLSNPAIANPIVTLSSDIDSVTYTVRASIGSCYSEDKVVVKVYKNGPDIVLPSAFTPNGDGKNDISKPVAFGITKLNYFSIYNRWGQIVFTTHELNKGWDGNFGGTPQPAGTFVYQAEGVDYKGRIVFRKGTLVLIR